jgi:lysyl-tRNA synthetase, class II
VVRKAGYNKAEELKGLNFNKLHQDLCGLNKKMKLELTNPSKEDVKLWIEQ